MVTPNKILPLLPPKAPNLPIGPVNYAQDYINQLLNVLRLYFNQLDNFSGAIANGGQSLSFPHASFHYDTQVVLSNNMTTTSTAPITVSSTTDYTAPGAILIGTEIISYTTIINPTTFDGTIVRGANGTTKSAHTAGAAVTSVQIAPANTRTAIIFNKIDYDVGVTLGSTPPSSTFTCNIPAIYNVQFSLQFSNPDTSADNVTIWFVINGADVLYSTGIVAVPSSHGGFSGQTIVGWNNFLPLNIGDTIQMYWTTNSGNSVLTTYPAGTGAVHPVSPAAAISFQFVSAA